MTADIFFALVVFAFVSTATPGPNNLMLMASGATYGYVRSLPHMLGIAFGFAFMLLGVGAGLLGLMNAWPASQLILKILCAGYMTLLAWRIAHAAPPDASRGTGRPLSFLEAAAFQWVNPKAWAMALTALSVYAPDASPLTFAGVALVFALVNLPVTSSWTLLGQQMSRFLTSPARRRAFNLSMAALLMLSLWPVLHAV